MEDGEATVAVAVAVAGAVAGAGTEGDPFGVATVFVFADAGFRIAAALAVGTRSLRESDLFGVGVSGCFSNGLAGPDPCNRPPVACKCRMGRIYKCSRFYMQ